MSAFEKAFERTIGHEGGYVNDPVDPGGETKFGISKRSYPDVDIKNLSLEKAKYLYKRDFWDRQKCSYLDANTAIELFDTSVNMGVGKGAKIFQEALNLCNRNERDYKDIAVDGGIGQMTIAAYNANKNKRRLHNVMNVLQGEHYVKLMRKKLAFEKYVGWFDRIEIIAK